MESYDPRYAFVTCSKCNQRWQRLDYGCAHHQITCGYPLPQQKEAMPSSGLTPEQWQEFDENHGISRIYR